VEAVIFSWLVVNPVQAAIFCWVVVISTVIIAILAILRQDEIAVGIILAVHLYLDWYLGLRVVALPMIVLFLAISLWMRSSWSVPVAFWLWGLLLILAIFPAIRGTLTLFDTLYYYPNVFIASFLTCWLGTIIAKEVVSIYRLFKTLTALSSVVAIHTIIAAQTGDAYFYEFGNGGIYRVGSFFLDANWNGSFLALILFISLGLFATTQSFLAKALFLIEIALLLVALLFTFSAGAWISCFIGFIFFLLFAGRRRFTVTLLITIILLLMAVSLHTEVESLFEHASDPVALSLRLNAWHTALQVIFAFPITGIGLGGIGYPARVEPYRVPTDVVVLDHPHNSYLELGAMAGLPVLITFLAILLAALWRAANNRARVEPGRRPLFAGGLTAVIVLSINSITINGWTLPPLAAVGWLILGAISSPLIGEHNSNTSIGPYAAFAASLPMRR
jgi:O-antigen ligase